MRRRRRHDFRAPLVITAAIAPGCGGAKEPPRLPVEPPPAFPEPAPEVLAEAAPDAGPPRPQTGDIVFEDPVCWRILEHAEREVTSCPEELLPEPPADRLIWTRHHEKPWCFIVHHEDDDLEWDQGRVRCPDGGATVAAGSSTIERDGTRIRISERTLTCSREVMANPPYWTEIERCPRALLPTLLGGAAPTREDDEGCWWNTIEVQCDPPRTDEPVNGTVEGRIIDIEAADTGTRITIDRGTRDGLKKGRRGKVIGLKNGRFTLDSCSARACTARVKATPDELQASSLDVVVE